MNRNEQALLEELQRRLPHGASPTSLGEKCGQTYARASSWACRYLKNLVKADLVHTEGRGYYVAGKDPRTKRSLK
jgi:hypothetical protein